MRRGRILPIAVLGFTFGLVLVIVGAVLLPRGSAPTPTPTPTPTPPPGEYYELGEWAVTSRQMVSVATAVNTSYCGAWAQETAPPATTFVIIDAVVINLGDTALHVSPGDFSLSDSEGRRYTSDDCLRRHEAFPKESLTLGQAASGNIAFVVPEIAEDLEVSYLLGGDPPVLAEWDLDL